MDTTSPSPVNEEIVDWDKVALSNYSTTLLSPQKWFETANQVGAAMAILEPQILVEWEMTREWARGRGIFPEHSLSGTYMMLAGLVIENLCKGHAVDGMHDDRHFLVPGGRSAHDSRLRAVRMNDLGLEPPNRRA